LEDEGGRRREEDPPTAGFDALPMGTAIRRVIQVSNRAARSGEGVVLAGIGLLRPPAVGRLSRAVYRDRFPPLLHHRIDRHGSISRNDQGILGLPSRDDSVLHRSDAFRLLPAMTAASG
jgi:hypothetical protein